MYLDNRQKLGFTVIQAVAHWSAHGGGMTGVRDNAANAYGHRPFTGDEKSPNTAEPLLFEEGNLNSPNDYWDHADYIIEAVKKRNMYLALLPCWADQFVTGTGEYTAEEAKSYGAFLGNVMEMSQILFGCWVAIPKRNLMPTIKIKSTANTITGIFTEQWQKGLYKGLPDKLRSGTSQIPRGMKFSLPTIQTETFLIAHRNGFTRMFGKMQMLWKYGKR